ncbi:Spy/CpxP family protein refolding chaperone [Lampropedia aestuarii]|nr:Spy/CpxP family protein refolding chaperone [Lampropedia aestuarii]MDH5858178.1 Spy/CpxP family protein refolding chaperone [Lampropedia aestuarii]
MTLSSSLRMLVATTALACTALIAQAQPQATDARAQSPRPTAESLADLKSKLNLSADQESAWAQYEEVAKPPANAPKEPRSGERPAPTEEQKAKIAQKREEARQAREEARITLRGHLNAEQQKILDEETSRPASPRGDKPAAH